MLRSTLQCGSPGCSVEQFVRLRQAVVEPVWNTLRLVNVAKMVLKSLDTHEAWRAFIVTSRCLMLSLLKYELEVFGILLSVFLYVSMFRLSEAYLRDAADPSAGEASLCRLPIRSSASLF